MAEAYGETTVTLVMSEEEATTVVNVLWAYIREGFPLDGDAYDRITEVGASLDYALGNF